jgi:hypothetical protein
MMDFIRSNSCYSITFNLKKYEMLGSIILNLFMRNIRCLCQSIVWIYSVSVSKSVIYAEDEFSNAGSLSKR